MIRDATVTYDDEAGSIGYREEQSPTLHGGASGTNQVPSILHENKGGDASVSDIAYTLRHGANRNYQLVNAVRRLTPLECERLQGFPDGWTCLCKAKGDTMRCTCTDSPRYRALGNAVTVPVAEWVGRRIMAVEATMTDVRAAARQGRDGADRGSAILSLLSS